MSDLHVVPLADSASDSRDVTTGPVLSGSAQNSGVKVAALDSVD